MERSTPEAWSGQTRGSSGTGAGKSSQRRTCGPMASNRSGESPGLALGTTPPVTVGHLWDSSLAARLRGSTTGWCPCPARHGGLGEATGRPKKMQATCLIDHKWPYNENLSPPQSWGCLVLAPSADGLGGSA